MVVFVTYGALLLVVLIGSSYGYPSKIAPAPAAPEEVLQLQPEAAAFSVQPVAVSQGTNIPAPSGYSSPGGFQHASAQDVSWAIQPLSILSGAGYVADSEPLGYVYESHPQYHGGDISQYEGSYEHGNSESETHGQRYKSNPLADHVYISKSQPLGLSAVGGLGSWPASSYPYDYMIMTGQYPPGTLTHSSQSYEQGTDQWHDTHYQRYNIPSYTTAEVQPAPTIQAPVKGQIPVKQTPTKEY